jgi:predicted kinase
MKRPRIVILRGKPAAGKSTAYATLRKHKKMKDFVFVDHCAMKTKFGREGGKKELFKELKKVMPSGKDIIIEEMSKESIMKGVSKEVKKYNYEFVVFQFEVDLKKAKKRDVKRVSSKKHYQKFLLDNIEDLHKMHEEKFDKEGILVDTNKLNKRQVVGLIVKNLTQTL